MSVTTTTHYGLKKPDGSEMIRPGPFNDNADLIDEKLFEQSEDIDAAYNALNQKIDTAVASKAEFVKLKEITTTTGGVSQIDVDVSDIDFSQWQYVILDTVLTGYTNLRVNGRTDENYIGFGYTQWQSNSLAPVSTFPQRTVLLSAMQQNARVGTLSIGDSVFVFGMSAYVTYSGLHTLNFVSSSALAAGSKILLWGVK